MPVIRLQEKTPYVYSNLSRDFQLMERAYDCIINGVKFDIDSMQNVTDTKLCRDRLLTLLASKLGFFTDKYIDSESIRLILEAFPIIIKNKGSLLGIKQAIFVFFKITSLRTEYKVDLHEDEYPNPHTVSIWIKGTQVDTTLLTEILKYVIPTGYNLDYTFYVSGGGKSKVVPVQRVVSIQVSTDLSAQLRTNGDDYADEDENNNIGAVNTMMLASNEDDYTSQVLEKKVIEEEEPEDESP